LKFLGNSPPIQKLHKPAKEVTKEEWRKVLPEEVRFVNFYILFAGCLLLTELFKSHTKRLNQALFT
jgi:hypothetical protein